MSRRARYLLTSLAALTPDDNTPPLPPPSKEIATASRQKILQLEKSLIADRALRKRNVLILAHVVLSIIAMIVVLQIEWNGEELVHTEASFYIKLGISISTLILIGQITEYYFRLLQYSIRFPSDQKPKNFSPMKIPAKPSQQTIEILTEEIRPLIHEDTPNYGTTQEKRAKRVQMEATRPSISTILKTTSLPRNYWVEVLIFLLHPIPVLSTTPTVTLISSQIGLFMFLRLYYAFKVYRDYSTIYRKRKILETVPGYSHSSHPVFDALISVKVLFHRKPVAFILFWIVIVGLISGYCIYVLERDLQPHRFSIWVGIYLSFISMFTGWPSDVYEEYDPRHFFTRLACIATTIVGLFLFALLIDYLHAKMRASKFEEIAIDWVNYIDLELERRYYAACLIQLVWKEYNIPDSDDTELLQKRFTVKFYKLVEINRKLRNKWNKLNLNRQGPFVGSEHAGSEKKEKNRSELAQVETMINNSLQEMRSKLLQDIISLLNESVDTMQLV